MREVSAKEREAIRQEMVEEFPGDELMQEIHSVRRLHQLQTEGMSVAEKIAYYRQKATGFATKSSPRGGS